MRTDSSPGTDPSLGVLPAREHLPAGVGDAPVLDVVIPVYNEERDLGPCVRRLHQHLVGTFPYRFRITIADNASTDATPDVAAALAAALPEVRNARLEQKGRGRALRTVWSASDAPVLAYMDVDLSTDLNALLPLVAPLISGHSDLAIGSRLARSSRVVRGPKREFISRAYNLILRGSLQARFSDAQCGFKAIRRDVARVLLPLVEDSGWFFDTEMLVLAERAGLRIHEVPVDWVDDPDSTVHIVKTATDDLKGVWRVGRALAVGALPWTGSPAPSATTRATARSRACHGDWPASWSASASSAPCRPSSICSSTPDSVRSRGRRSPTRWPCSSRPSPTRPPTGASPSASAAGTGPSATRRRASSCSRSGSP